MCLLECPALNLNHLIRQRLLLARPFSESLPAPRVSLVRHDLVTHVNFNALLYALYSIIPDGRGTVDSVRCSCPSSQFRHWQILN